MDKFFPVKTLRFNKYKHKKCQWVTHGILISIKYRDSLYSHLKSLPRNHPQYNINKINLQTYNRILRNSIRSAKKLYYQNCFEKFKNDMKNTWIIIKDIINKSKGKKDISKYFIINGEKVTDSNLIASQFNNFFANVGPSLAQKITPPVNKSYINYLFNAMECSFK